jgi:4-hydroxybenzoate polyprenyltransferase
MRDEGSPRSLAGLSLLPYFSHLVGWLRLLHPFPSLLNAAVVACLALVAVGGWPGLIAVRLTLTMLCIQCSIGALNDWADRSLDARTKPDKPIPAGLVSPALALLSAIILATIAALLALIGGPAAWLIAMCGMGTGFAYDLGLKRTPFSALTYAVALPLIPFWVWTALGVATPALYAVLPVGMLLGGALQLANALPDAEGDRSAGLHGTLQWLGPERGRRAAWLAFGVALALAVVLAVLAGLRPLPFVPCWLVATALYTGSVLSYRFDPSRRSLQRGWTMLAPAAALLAVGWLASLP